MAKIYHVTPMLRMVNRTMRLMIRLGVAPKNTHLLTVRGRKTGRSYSTPVSLVIHGQDSWLVSPYGEVAWVRNARVAGEVILSRKGTSETVKISELGPEASAPILQEYIKNESITRPYFDVTLDSPLEAFIAEAPRHPVFRIQRGA